MTQVPDNRTSPQPASVLAIAIDGPAASGKGTIAKAVASHFGLRHLDTGALYRGVGLAVTLAGGDPGDAEAAARAAHALDPMLLGDPRLRSAEAGMAASKVAAVPAVRAALLAFQRRFAQTPPGAVLDGRDIATVILPDAPAKLFVTAGLETRARRRHAELIGRGESVDLADVLADLRLRDERDSNRAVAPLTQAPDADLLDTTELSIEAAVAAAIDLISRKLT